MHLDKKEGGGRRRDVGLFGIFICVLKHVPQVLNVFSNLFPITPHFIPHPLR